MKIQITCATCGHVVITSYKGEEDVEYDIEIVEHMQKLGYRFLDDGIYCEVCIMQRSVVLHKKSVASAKAGLETSKRFLRIAERRVKKAQKTRIENNTMIEF